VFGFLRLHLPFFRFFRRHRGWQFCLKTTFWRFLYDAYSAVGFGLGTVFFVATLCRRAMTKGLRSEQPDAFCLPAAAATSVANIR
jgi:hypothetical protein